MDEGGSARLCADAGVDAQTEGALRPGTGSLYAALQRLEEDGLLDASPRRPSLGEDERRTCFRITEAGRAAAREEARR